jgi:type I restriction enzyme R subunit
MKFAESHVEEATLEWLAEIGYSTANGFVIGPDGPAPERDNYAQVVLPARLHAAIERLNPTLSPEERAEVFAKVLQVETPSAIAENRRLHRYMVEGVPIEVVRADGTIGGEQARLIDMVDCAANDWLAVNQFTVIENKANRRPDVVIFINGLPLGVIELKNPGDENATIDGAFNQLQTYREQIPSLFRTNAALVISDGLAARIGSLTADRERFMPWRTIDGEGIEPKGSPELETVLKGVFHPERFLQLIRDFTIFADTGEQTIKIIAGYHQFHATLRAVAATIRALPSGAGGPSSPTEASNDTLPYLQSRVRERPESYGLPSAAAHPPGDKRIGVIWHTQGSGKSLLMAFYAGLIVKHPAMENPTLVVLTDRNDLDDQLFATFGMARDLIRQTPLQASDRADLRELLDRPSGGVIFTTLQKFAPEVGEKEIEALTDRRNVVVIADEAHRSQYGLKAKVSKEGDVSYGFAKHMRDALPNASFIGFTGTPVEAEDVNTRAVFGDYIDIYDIARAVEDGATVPIYYESRLARIELDEDERPNIDAEVAEVTGEEADSEQERLKRKWASVEALVGSDKRLEMIADDLVRHFEARAEALDGKAMIVCMSRRICVALYDAIVKLRPDWHSDDDEAGAIKVVMTGAASDPPTWQKHIGKRAKARRELIAKRAKNAADSLKLVIVRDMWLTGFDAPSMHTMYIDKPMKGHGLMQAIARVNRVFRDKPAGLVVDYIGIAQNLKSALGRYSGGDREHTGIDEAQAVLVMREKYEVVRAMFRPDQPGGFDYRPVLSQEATAGKRLVIMAGAMNWILELQQADAARATTEDAKKAAHRRYADAVVALSKAYALAAASDEAKAIRDEVGFFQAIRAALVKSSATSGKRSAADREMAIQQIVSRAVVSTDIIDIMRAAGIESPDISILSDAFLAEVRDNPQKNLAIEALRKLINGEVQSRSKSNVTQSKAFTERLDAAIARYHTNALTTAEVLEQLIQLAKEIREARQRGEESGLSDEEIAFYDALAENDSAREAMGEPALRIIAHELVVAVRDNATVDWIHRASARANIRRLVKRLLRKYGYPPDLQDAAVQTVLQQAEALASEWA